MGQWRGHEPGLPSVLSVLTGRSDGGATHVPRRVKHAHAIVRLLKYHPLTAFAKYWKVTGRRADSRCTSAQVHRAPDLGQGRVQYCGLACAMVDRGWSWRQTCASSIG
jgi:hypothetical protein